MVALSPRYLACMLCFVTQATEGAMSNGLTGLERFLLIIAVALIVAFVIGAFTLRPV